MPEQPPRPESRIERLQRLAAGVAERRERVRQQAAIATQEKGRRLEAQYEAQLANRAKRRAERDERVGLILEAIRERAERLQLARQDEILREWRTRSRIPLSTDPEVIRQSILDDLTSRGQRIPPCYATPGESNRFIGLVIMMNREEIFNQAQREARRQLQQQ